MATKVENRELVVELVADLSLEIEVPALDDLDSKEWAKMVSDLKAKKRDADNPTPADGDADAKSFYVKKGKAVTTKKGVIADGATIEPEWVNGGVDTLQSLVDRGYVGKK